MNSLAQRVLTFSFLVGVNRGGEKNEVEHN